MEETLGMFNGSRCNNITSRKAEEVRGVRRAVDGTLFASDLPHVAVVTTASSLL